MKVVCIVCGKPVKASAKMVHMRTDARVFTDDFDYRVSPSNDQGWFEIGPACYRKVYAAGRDGFRL
jgi:hypothetical protein